MNDKNFDKCKVLIEKYFKSLNYKKSKFIPGKSNIPLAIPPYGSDEVIESLESLMSTNVTGGDKVSKFEKKFSKYVGTKHGIMVNSGSSANLLALSILSHPSLKNRIMPGDEIITPAVTWATTVYPILNINAIPKFVDVKSNDYTIDPEEIENAITKKTKALLIVHLLGNPCDMNKISKIANKHNLWLMEDSCEAHGAKYDGKHVGTFGDIATFSFYASHHITTIEGGMVLTNNNGLNELGRSMRTFGWSRELSSKKQLEKKFPGIDPRFLFVNTGFNFRPTEIQGSFGIHQIDKLEKLVKTRIKNANYWTKRLRIFSNYLILPDENRHRKSFLLYPITVKKNKFFTKNDLVTELEKNGIATRPLMTGNILNQPVSKFMKYKNSGQLKNANNIQKNSFLIGNHHEILDDQRKFIADIISNYINSKIN